MAKISEVFGQVSDCSRTIAAAVAGTARKLRNG
jgi:hypothetical protein